MPDRKKKMRASIELDWMSLIDCVSLSILDKFEESKDVVRFGAVCKLWLSSSRDYFDHMKRTRHKAFPMLLTAAEGDLFCVVEGKVIQSAPLGLHFEPTRKKLFSGSCHGWWAFWDIENNNVILQKLFGKGKGTIQLPPLPSELLNQGVGKVIISADPGECPGDCVVLGMSEFTGKLVYTRLGEASWGLIHDIVQLKGDVCDVTFYKGAAYAISFHGEIICIDFNSSSKYSCSNNMPAGVKLGVANLELLPPDFTRFLLVESSRGDLLLVVDHRSNAAQEFLVCKLSIDCENGRLTGMQEMNSLDGDSLFLGHYPSMNFSLTGLESDCIYSYRFMRETPDITVLNVKDKSRRTINVSRLLCLPQEEDDWFNLDVPLPPAVCFSTRGSHKKLVGMPLVMSSRDMFSKSWEVATNKVSP